MKSSKVSVVMPCLNEEATVSACVRFAKRSLARLQKHGFRGEVIVADNGSTDGSVSRAKQAGARVIHAFPRGYGAAYRAGIKAASGTYIVIADSDGTYDFSALHEIIAKLQNGADLVLGSRFKGTILPGSMPMLNRYIGNPILTNILNTFYGTHISDAHTGMRGFTKRAYKKLGLRSLGMEFASEMIVKAFSQGLTIEEIPITYHPRKGTSKLSPVSDAWRHIKFMLLYAPTYVLIAPGLFALVLGLSLSTYLVTGPKQLFGWNFDIHSMTVGLLVAFFGIQLVIMGFLGKLFTHTVLGIAPGPLTKFLLKNITVERLMEMGGILVIGGTGYIMVIAYRWAASGFGPLSAIRETLYASGIAILGALILFSSFLYGLLTEPGNGFMRDE